MEHQKGLNGFPQTMESRTGEPMRHFAAQPATPGQRALYPGNRATPTQSRCHLRAGSGKFAAMKSVRTHRSPLALLLAGLILLGALACSIGHGQMLGAFMPAMSSDICGPDQALSHGPEHSPDSAGHGLLMQLALFDCAYASKLTNALLGFAALGWLLRIMRRRALMPERLSWTSLRHCSPGRVAQAP